MINVEDNRQIDDVEHQNDHVDHQIDDDVVANQINRQDGNDEYLFTVGEIVVFRGTDDLKFNLMLVTKNIKRDKVDVRTKVVGNFLTEQDQKEQYVTLVEDKDWVGASMMFAHVLTL